MKPEEIQALRKQLSCTARELAGAIGVDQATVLAWERAELFPTKQHVDRMQALLVAGPGAVPRARRGKASTPMKALADPAVWTIVRKLLTHAPLRDAVTRLAADYSDPVDDE